MAREESRPLDALRAGGAGGGGAAAPGEAGAAGPPSPEMLRRARLFWEQGQADLKEARRLLRAQAWLESSFLSFQASVNVLTGVCHLHGEYRVPSASPLRLAGLVQGYDPLLAGLGPAAEALEAAQALNPYAPERDPLDEQRQSRLYYDHSDSILKAVRGYLKRNRRRFFAP
jgi:HEPN domain-containing protein